MKHLKITTAELSKICGVSQGTIYRALNNRSDISAETKKRIINVARQYGYREHIDSNSEDKIIGQVGIIVFNLNNEYFSTLITETERILHKLGLSAVIMITHYDKQYEIECIRNMYNMGVQGIVLCSVNRGSEFDNYRYILYLAGIFAVIFLTSFAAIRFSTPLSGVSPVDIGHLNEGWSCESGNELTAIDKFPCTIDAQGDRLYLVRDLSDVHKDTSYVLTFKTRYASIRVWADKTMVYEAAQGMEHALGSMWHFIPICDFENASKIRVELTKYSPDEHWSLDDVLLDHPYVVLLNTLGSHALSIIFYLAYMMLAFLLLVVVIFMAFRKIPGITTIAALLAFVFVSSQWILLDSKITTLFGGNYAISYFFSYCAFYLLPFSLVMYIYTLLERRSFFLRCLTWLTLGNVIVCMGLHLSGAVQIRNTAFTVHILLILSVLVSTWEIYRSVIKLGNKGSIYTLLGFCGVYLGGMISLVLYYIGYLPPTNNTGLYSWSLLMLIAGMTLDAIFVFSRFWSEKQLADQYHHLAVYDSMTKLKNRNAFELHMKNMLDNPPKQVVMILFDVDNLKIINDTYGHYMGDQMINLISQCIRDIFEPLGVCYRIGGDEFCVIMNSGDEICENLERCNALIEKRSKDKIPIHLSNGWAYKAFEAGKEITMEDINALKKEADINLYYNKREYKRGNK